MAGCFGHCAQEICNRFAGRLGLTEEQAVGMGAAFGCGMGNGETCGCYTAGLMVLGQRYSACPFAQAEQRRDIMVRKVTDFERRFASVQPHRLCRDILGVDITRGDGMAQAMAAGSITAICLPLIRETCRILDEILAEDGEAGRQGAGRSGA